MSLYVGNTALLLHGNGADGSTVFTDETGKTVTAYGNARISTAQSKFGGSSMYFDGAVDLLAVPYSTDFAFGTGDFTVEAFISPNATSLTGYHSVVGLDDTTSGPVLTLNNGYLTFFSAGIVCEHQTVISAGVMQHIAFVRVNGMILLFVDGVKSTSTPSHTSNIPTIRGVQIGASTTTAQEPFAGYIDDLRITRSIALYAANFTPPTAPLEIGAPIQIQIQGHDPGITKLAKYDPSRVKPVMQEVADDLQDRMPYGLWQTPAVVSEFKGRGVISGAVKVFGSPDNVPLGRLVRLHREPDGMFVSATWSDPTTGAYTFNGVRPDCKYSVTSFDYQHGYRAVIADNLSATPI